MQNKTEGRRTGPRRHRVVCHRLHCGRHILGAENKEARVCTTRVTYYPGEGWPTCQSVGRVCRWRRRSDHTDMRERQWRPQARRRAWGVHVDHDIYMPESMERVWSLARVERRRGATGERVVCGYSMSRNILETDLRVNRLGDLREGLLFGSLFRAQRGPRLVGVPEATMGPELHRRAYS